jgi:hypothetical protein
MSKIERSHPKYLLSLNITFLSCPRTLSSANSQHILFPEVRLLVAPCPNPNLKHHRLPIVHCLTFDLSSLADPTRSVHSR